VGEAGIEPAAQTKLTIPALPIVQVFSPITAEPHGWTVCLYKSNQYLITKFIDYHPLAGLTIVGQSSINLNS
jgi:hypothetical protein